MYMYIHFCIYASYSTSNFHLFVVLIYKLYMSVIAKLSYEYILFHLAQCTMYPVSELQSQNGFIQDILSLGREPLIYRNPTKMYMPIDIESAYVHVHTQCFR